MFSTWIQYWIPFEDNENTTNLINNLYSRFDSLTNDDSFDLDGYVNNDILSKLTFHFNKDFKQYIQDTDTSSSHL